MLLLTTKHPRLSESNFAKVNAQIIMQLKQWISYLLTVLKEIYIMSTITAWTNQLWHWFASDSFLINASFFLTHIISHVPVKKCSILRDVLRVNMKWNEIYFTFASVYLFIITLKQGLTKWFYFWMWKCFFSFFLYIFFFQFFSSYVRCPHCFFKK